MNRRELLFSAATATTVIGLTPRPSPAHPGHRAIHSISAMTFAPDGRLIVADWKDGRLHALALPSAEPRPDASFKVKGLSEALAQTDGLTADRIRPTAAAFEAESGRAIVAYTAGKGPDDPVRLAIVLADGTSEIVDPTPLSHSSMAIAGPPQNEAQIWGETPARALLVTDVAAHAPADGPVELLVAGIANSDFASTLRRVPYPFGEGPTTMSRIEMYHAVHDQLETRAPIRAMAILDIDGAPHLLAAYTCTPLVTVPLSDLQDGAKVRAKTIAELGFGNTPLGIVPFTLGQDPDTTRWVIVANAAKSADLISHAAIADAAARPGLRAPVRPPFETTAGLTPAQMPITGVLSLLDQSSEFLLALRRDPASGELELVSYRKGAFFRLSDFVNEYDMPGFTYSDDAFQQEVIRPLHNVMKADEGHASLRR